MIEEDRRPDENEADLEAVATAWRRLPADEPPDLLDQAVLNRARRDLESKRPRGLRWIGPFATAGVAVVALSVWLLQDQGPAAPGGDGSLRVAPMVTAPVMPAPPEERQSPTPAASAVRESAPVPERSVARSKGQSMRAEEALAESEAPAAVARARAAADETAEQRAPDEWIEYLLALRTAGRTEELRTELDAFRAAYPDYPLPPALRDD